MNGSLEAVIATLTRRLRDKERRANEFIGAANELRETINLLCVQAGLPPRFPTGGGGEDDAAGIGAEASGEPLPASSRATRITADSFFGKRQATAIRDFLEMRRAAGEGPARPREIYDALRSGGYAFKAQDDETALVSLRSLLRKNQVFMKVPGTSGAYGLRVWYPHVKAAKATGGEADADAKPETQENPAEQPTTAAAEMKENAA